MKNRVIWKMFVLTIVTIGIYRLYWFIKTRKEMMHTKPGVKIMSPAFFLLPVVLIIVSLGVFIASMISSAANDPSYCPDYSYSSAGNSSHYSTIPPECQDNGSVLPIIMLYASFLLFWPLMVVWLWSYSKGVEAVTKGKTSFPLALIILLAVPDGIDILIIQDGFNKLSAPKS